LKKLTSTGLRAWAKKYCTAMNISPDGSTPERASYGDVLLINRFRKALRKLNPHLPAETIEEMLRKVQQTKKQRFW